MGDWARLPRDSLTMTARYGPRLYRNGSLLHHHVDIWETHVLSAIVAVGHRGLRQPWPLEVLDHSGKMHYINDVPGDVVFYESATCSHGRESMPLNGREVANMFLHFKPSSGWEPISGDGMAGIRNDDKVGRSIEL